MQQTACKVVNIKVNNFGAPTLYAHDCKSGYRLSNSLSQNIYHTYFAWSYTFVVGVIVVQLVAFCRFDL